MKVGPLPGANLLSQLGPRPRRTKTQPHLSGPSLATTLVALDGPAGEVNVALLTDGPKGTSWKFQIVERKVA